jgi:hypothetical protein
VVGKAFECALMLTARPMIEKLSHKLLLSVSLYLYTRNLAYLETMLIFFELR